MSTVGEERIGQIGGVAVEAAATASHLVVTTQDGVTRHIVGEAGLSVMQVIRNADIAELPALCGGCCSCATCHVHIAPEWFGLLPAMSDEESALLDEVVDRTALSRLSCQIPFSDALDGLRVDVARME